MASIIRHGLPAALLLTTLASSALAHEHHTDEIPEGSGISAEPLDSILWTHIVVQTCAFGIVFPTGMVLGIVRNRWHVPVQVFGSLIAVLGYFLGHLHKGRQFAPTAHAHFANWLMFGLLCQVVLGIYLKLHLEKGILGRTRPVFRFAHGLIGKVMPVASWVQMLFGGIAALGFCRDDHFGQCLAHFIMGSAFIGYGILLLILLLVGQQWILRTGRSPEFFDSAVIAAWGCVNTFTEHRWGQDWPPQDVQHTSMGVVWWAAGLCGMWMSRGSGGQAKRNFIPGLVILLTGWAMSGHAQHLMLSTMVHAMFGYSLMAAGLARIIEVAFVVKDKNSVDASGEPQSFQFITPFMLLASGFIFMGATEEQMDLLTTYGIGHIGYILILYSFAFLLFLFVHLLISLYSSNSAPTVPPKDVEGEDGPRRAPRMNGHRYTESRQIRDAEEFELHGLISDQEGDEDAQEISNRRSGLESPSTLGKNSETRAD